MTAAGTVACEPEGFLDDALPERRRHIRCPQEMAVRLLDSGARPIGGGVQICDLSLGGLGLHSGVPLVVGREVGFNLRLPDGRPLRGSTRVRWNRKSGLGFAQGLEIVRMGFFARQRLQAYLFPRHFGILKAASLGLEVAVALTAVLLLRELLRMLSISPAVLLESLPFGVIFLAVGVGIGYHLRDRL